MKILCPEFATYVRNRYFKPARLFITGGKEIESDEETTQGDPTVMAMYALGILPLLQHNIDIPRGEKTKRTAYADDFTGIGTLQEINRGGTTSTKLGHTLAVIEKNQKVS